MAVLKIELLGLYLEGYLSIFEISINNNNWCIFIIINCHNNTMYDKKINQSNYDIAIQFCQSKSKTFTFLKVD